VRGRESRYEHEVLRPQDVNITVIQEEPPVEQARSLPPDPLQEDPVALERAVTARQGEGE
jgi:hypothetical protein